jgi:putative transposase
MNREVHVRFRESAGLQCSAPLTFTKAYGSVIEARRGIGGWLSFYNDERPHQALGYRTPRVAFAGEACEHVDNTCAPLRAAAALPTCSQAQHQEEKEVLMY